MNFYLQEDMVNRINSINNVEVAIYDDEELDILYKSEPLYFMDIPYPPLMPRQLGYDLNVKDIFDAGIDFQSAEGMKEFDGFSQPYCNNYYFFTRAIGPNRVKVTIRYLGPPENKKKWNINIYNNSIRKKVELNSCYKLVNDPYYDELEEMGIPHDKQVVRISDNGSFLFETEFDADTYGDVMLKVDQIIYDLEK